MFPLRPSAARALGLLLFAALLTGCGLRQRREAAETEAAAASVTAPPSEVGATPVPEATAAASGDDQGAQIDAQLGALEDALNQTDTVPEGANP